MSEILNDPEALGTNFVLPFQIGDNQLRGRLVRLSGTLDTILGQHAYPAPVSQLLAEAMVMATALGSALKYEGLFTLQFKTDGVVNLLIADVTSEGGVRGYARFNPQRLESQPERLIGAGTLAFTVGQSQAQQDHYQGVVELDSGSLAAAVQHYFQQSEQIQTGIVVAARQDADGHWQGGCILLQRMPQTGGFKPANDTGWDEHWQHALTMLQSCKAEELTDPALTPADLLYRLFHESGVRAFEAKQFHHQCRCSEDRVVGMLQSLPRAEIETLAVNGIVTVTCEFCNRSYVFDETRREEIFSKDGSSLPPP